VTEGVSISGPGPQKLIVRRLASSNFRIFTVTATGSVSLSGMTIRDGLLGGIGASGGGITSGSGTLQVTNCSLLNNGAPFGGGVATQGGTLTLTNCIFSGNSGTSAGGGVYSDAATVTITNCAFTGNNHSASGGGLYLQNGVIDIINSLIADSGGGQAGGILNQGATTNITNSTLWNNFTESNGGGIYCGSGTVNVTNCTVSDNTTSQSVRSGAGVFASSGHVNIKSSIIASNHSVGIMDDLGGAGTFMSQGFDLIGENGGASAAFPAGNPNPNNDIVGTPASPIDPKLDPNGLRDNGGATATVALQSDSFAIDKGTSNGSTGHLTTDQRGLGYLRTIDDPGVPNAAGGDGADSGAFEFGAHVPTVSRKTHGAAGTFDLDVAVGSNGGIECRSGGATNDHQLVITFPTSVSVTGNPQAMVTAGTGQIGSNGSANGGVVSVSGATVTIPLTNIANAQKIGVTLFNVSNGSQTNDVSIPVGILLGDTSGNGSVNASDVSQTKARSGQAVDATNFRSDVTVNGSINASDVSLVKSKSGTALP
jgi:hypothetical protein